ncbi:MAG: AAA family ATPase [Spirochaetaceae bacterium]|nr:MAG: AAA family ATPase [Spirochaetaceae bacterium]
MRAACVRLAHRHGTVAPVITNAIHDSILAEETGDYPPIPFIVTDLGQLFSLEESEMRIIAALYALENTESLGEVMRNAPDWTALSVLAGAAAVETQEFVAKTAPGGRLDQLGLVVYRGGRDELSDISLSRPVLFSFRSNTLDDLRAGLFSETPASRYGLHEFSLPPEEVRNCLAAISGGYPVLLSGNPGVGKTEFARSLAAAAGRTVHTLAAIQERSIERGRSPATMTRLGAVRMAANLLNRNADLLIVDEADAILQSASGFLGLFGGGSSNYDKAELNDLLESLPVSTIWITNEHQMIPTSALRRFGHVVDFPNPNAEIRTRMLVEHLGPLTSGASSNDAPPVCTPWIRDLAATYDLTPAAIERATRIVTTELETGTIQPGDVPNRVAGYLRQSSSGAFSRDIRRLPAVSPSFDPRFCNTSEPLDRLERLATHRVREGRGLRLLLAGPPGGGKTQYALWLSRHLQCDVILKRPSDLLSKYVGDSEKQIAAAFSQAEKSGSVLVIDEADALLYSRETAVRSWEHSQIAEFLQQIQEFEGILIACTNRVEAVDPALRRRFHKHLTFGPIGGGTLSDDPGRGAPSVLEAALAHIFPAVPFSREDLDTLRRGPALMMSDLATAAEMIAIGGPPAASQAGSCPREAAREVIREILAGAKARSTAREIGF